MDKITENIPKMHNYFQQCVTGIQKSIDSSANIQNKPIGHLLAENAKKLTQRAGNVSQSEKNGAKIMLNYKISKHSSHPNAGSKNSKSTKFQPFYDNRGITGVESQIGRGRNHGMSHLQNGNNGGRQS
jgi:hypothetical protein